MEMRRIIPKHEEVRKKKKNQFIVGGVLIFIMIFSMLGYAFQSQIFNSSTPSTNANVTYNGMTFTNENGFWATVYDNERLSFSYLPSQIFESNLTNFTKSLGDLKDKPLYISSEDHNAESEMRFNLLPFAEKIESACLEGEECQGEQIKDCTDNFIVLREGAEGVVQEQNCIFISGSGENLIKLADNVLFKLFGVR